ncbi:helix-turn-helix domain-containing protein [Patescibacteria group bacterium]|nr:helix-turn-helix domain-containing protein [Patescibacteria group bacterium]
MAKKRKQSLKPLEAIKRLLILNAMLNGAESKDIAEILEISKRRVQQIVPIKEIKKKKKS